MARGLWTPGLRGKCVKAEDHNDDNSCCASKLLGAQPDFMNQPEWIVEEVEKSGNIPFFLPKFHRELLGIWKISTSQNMRV